LAIILPVLLLIVVAIIDLGRAVYAYHVVANCAREGARSSQVWPRPDDTWISYKATATAVGLDPADIVVSVSHPTGATVQVVVSYTFHLITPLVAQVLGRGTLLLRGTSTMYTGY
jgi:Flp pilus assembly protein TadG